MADSREGGPLVVSGGGSTAVATDELSALGSRLRDLEGRAIGWADTLAGLARVSADPVVEPMLWSARAHAAAIAAEAENLAARLGEAAEAYGDVERAAARVQEQLAGVLGWLAGFLGPVVVPSLAAAAAIVTADAVLAWFIAQGLRRLRGEPVADPGAWLQEHSGVINSPATVALVRALVSSVDDVAAGAARVPLPITRALGDSGLRLTGVDTSALGVLMLAGLFGLLRETPVRARQVTAAGAPVASPSRRGARTGPRAGQAVSAPTGVGELIERVPSASADGPQVRIERYGSRADATWVAYIGGTVSWEAAPAGEPWDLTSNVQGVAGGDPGSYRSVVEALEQAGAGDGDRVLAVGHSQGGLLAARLATDERFTAAGLVTAGAPIGQIALPPGLPVLQVEHSDDLVPALGGFAGADDSPEHVLVRREYLADRSGPITGWVPSHDLMGYRETAGIIDGSDDPRLERMRAELRAVTGSGGGSVTWWRGERAGLSPRDADG